MIWKPVNYGKFGEYYEVSDDAQVRSVDRVITSSTGRPRHYKGKMMSLGVCRGYRCVTLQRKGLIKRPLVGVLVALTHVGEPPGTPGNRKGEWVVKRRDGNKLNDHCSNLYWEQIRGGVMKLMDHEAAVKADFENGLRLSELAIKYHVNITEAQEFVRVHFPDSPRIAKNKSDNVTATVEEMVTHMALNFSSMAEACRELGLDYKNMVNRLQLRAHSHFVFAKDDLMDTMNKVREGKTWDQIYKEFA